MYMGRRQARQQPLGGAAQQETGERPNSAAEYPAPQQGADREAPARSGIPQQTGPNRGGETTYATEQGPGGRGARAEEGPFLAYRAAIPCVRYVWRRHSPSILDGDSAPTNCARHRLRCGWASRQRTPRRLCAALLWVSVSRHRKPLRPVAKQRGARPIHGHGALCGVKPGRVRARRGFHAGLCAHERANDGWASHDEQYVGP